MSARPCDQDGTSAGGHRRDHFSSVLTYLNRSTDRTGLRFDIRHIRAISGPDNPFDRPGVSRLRFWRATAGVTIRY